MKRQWLLGIVGTLTALTAGMFILVGCGGGGGPVTGNETGPPPSVSNQFLQLLPASQTNATYVGVDRCTPCHTDLHTQWLTTRHSQVNVGCEQCHGPGSVHVTNRSAATPVVDADILTFPTSTEPIVCGQCHGPTFDQYMNSRHHGVVEAVAEEAHSNPNTYAKTCFRCHSAQFRAQFVDVPLSKGQTRDQIDAGIQALTLAQLTPQVEAAHQSAACVSCHDPHQATQNIPSTGRQSQLRRALVNTDLTDVGPNQPPKVYTTNNHICGSCHNNRGGDPSDAGLQKNTVRPATHEGPEYNMLNGQGGNLPSGAIIPTSSHQEAPDQCVHCHMPDRRHTFTVSLDTSCAPCHTAADAAARESAVQSEVQSGLVALRTRMETYARLNFGDSDLWEYTSNIQALSKTPPNQSLVPIQVKRARHNYYFILLDRSLGVHNTFYTRQLLQESNTGLDAIGIPRSVPRSALPPAAQRQLLQQDLKRAMIASAHEN